MKFGNWNITDSEIAWGGTDGNSFTVNRATLLETEQGSDGTTMYSRLVQATDEEWLEEDALYDLNFAFVFVAGKNPDQFSYEILEDTLDYQFDMRDEAEDDEDEDEEDEEENV